ncbi:MFS transporter [Halobium salinum]|uniref:MFS transporter n=1 Tax=Halobium salinum TaxID=1364940 RepID=A0ABD5PGS5_9EURY|nr:MFS transporter [Halobium salinum]
MKDRWLVGWGLGYAAVGAASLLLPLYALSLGAGPLLVGLMASTAAFAGVPGAILWGKLAAATHRRRPLVLVALGATAGVLAVVPAIASPWPLLVANAALWFVVSAAAPVLNLVVVEGVPSDGWDRQFARLNSYQGYGWLGGLLAGAVWNALAPGVFGAAAAQRLFFYLIAAAAAAGLVVVRARYPPSPTTDPERFARVSRELHRRPWGAGRYVRTIPFGPGRVYWALRSLRSSRPRDGSADRPPLAAVRERLAGPLGRYLLAATLFFVGFSAFFGPLPAYLADAGYATGEVFALFVLSSAGSAVAYGVAGDLASRRDPRWLQTAALVVRTAAFPLVAVVGAMGLGTAGLVGVGALFAVVGVTWAVIAVTGTGLVSRLAPADTRGEALGAYTAVGGVGGGVGSALGGVAAEGVGYLGAFVAAALLVLAAAGLVASDSRAENAAPSQCEGTETAD